ncbi:MAG: hypothetical protein WD059_15940 [Balneolaceae bacterium]
MVQIIKKTDAASSAKKKISKIENRPEKIFDADKFCGIIKWDIDAVEYQREIRKDRIEPTR